MSHSNTPPVRNRTPLTARSSSLRCVSAAEHQTAEQYSKSGRTKPRKHLPRSALSWNTRQDFLKIPSLCEAALKTERTCFSKVIFESNVTPKITVLGSRLFNSLPEYLRHQKYRKQKNQLELSKFLELAQSVQLKVSVARSNSILDQLPHRRVQRIEQGGGVPDLAMQMAFSNHSK